MMSVIDNFLECDVQNFTDLFSTKRQNSAELLEEALANINVEELSSHNLGSPASELDVTDLLLEDLVDIQANLNDSPSKASGENGASARLSDERVLYESEDLKNVSNAEFNISELIMNSSLEPPVIDFAVNENNEISSYIDCMRQWPNSTTAVNKTFYPENLIDIAMFDINSKVDLEDLNVGNDLYLPLENIDHQGDVSKASLVEYDGDCFSSLPPESNNPATTTLHNNMELEEIMSIINDINSMNSPTHETTVDDTILKAGVKRSSSMMEGDHGIGQSDEWRAVDQSIFDNVLASSTAPKRMLSSEESMSESDTSVHTHSNGFLDKKSARKTNNNEASRVHRAKKKKKFEELFERQVDLEKNNANLKMQVESMQKEAKFLKELLLVKVAATS